MFDLEISITEWRLKMLAAGMKTPVPLDELETHLREEIERQTRSGQNEAVAFKSAVEIIGPAHTVQREFAAAEAFEETRNWKVGQIWFGIILGLLQLIVIGAVLFNSEMTFTQRMSGLAAMATAILLVTTVGRLSYQIFPVIRTRLNRTGVVFLTGSVLGIIWFSIFARLLAPGHDFGEYLMTLLWVNCPPLGVFLGLIVGTETAARKKVVLPSS